MTPVTSGSETKPLADDTRGLAPAPPAPPLPVLPPVPVLPPLLLQAPPAPPMNSAAASGVIKRYDNFFMISRPRLSLGSGGSGKIDLDGRQTAGPQVKEWCSIFPHVCRVKTEDRAGLRRSGPAGELPRSLHS